MIAAAHQANSQPPTIVVLFISAVDSFPLHTLSYMVLYYYYYYYDYYYLSSMLRIWWLHMHLFILFLPPFFSLFSPVLLEDRTTLTPFFALNFLSLFCFLSHPQHQGVYL